MDVTTIGATLIYGLVSASATKLARERRDRKEWRFGVAGLAIMIAFGLYMLVPNLYAAGTMARESYLFFVVWAVLGFIYFHRLLVTDSAHRFGKSIVVLIALSLVMLVKTFRMISERAQISEAQLGMVKEIASRDALTGVKSRNAFAEKEREVDAAISGGTAAMFAIAVCDLNGLKLINDSMGHKAGDERLKQASKVICDVFSHSPVYRNGGDEFVAFLSGRDFEDRHELLERMHGISVSHISTGEVVISVGMSEYEPGGDTRLRSVFDRADARMYEEKMLLKSMGAVTR